MRRGHVTPRRLTWDKVPHRHPSRARNIAADDVAKVTDRVSVAPLNGVVEVAGPEQFTLDMLIRRVHGAIDEPREVLTDPQARYFGAVLSQRTLVPNAAILGEIRLMDGSARA